MKEYFEYDTEFQYIEDLIDNLTTECQNINENLPNFSKKTWAINDFPYIQEVYRIEEAINNFNKFIVILPNYIYKKWLVSPYAIDYKNFSWSDYKNWTNALDQISIYKDQIELRYCGEGYSSDTIWL